MSNSKTTIKMKDGNSYDAKQFNYGYKFRGNMVEVKLRFSEDIANIVNERFKCENMFKAFSADGYNIIYGHVNPDQFNELRATIGDAKIERLQNKAAELQYMVYKLRNEKPYELAE